MIARSLLAAALGLGTWTSISPAPIRYRLEVKTTQIVHAAALGQGDQRTEFTTTAFISVTARDSGLGQAIVVVLDSLRLSDSAPVPPEMATGAVGLRWHGFRKPGGRVEDLTLDGDNPFARSLESLVSQLFPPIRPGMAAGARWTDTTETGAGSGLTVRTVTSFEASTQRGAGARGTKLTGTSSSTIRGSQETPQGSMSFEGTGVGNSSWLLSAAGTTLSATYSGSQSLAITAAFAPEPLPVEVTIVGSVNQLK